jgi:two-component system, OmpR family, phosphate regulon response regulator PhoB
MVVDDDPLILEVVATVLDLEEFEVHTAMSAQEALDRLPGLAVALVVSDVMMPDMDGFEFAARLRKEEATANLPVVMLTARDSGDDRARGQEAGVDAYLTKPFSPLELLDVIEDLLPEGR